MLILSTTKIVSNSFL